MQTDASSAFGTIQKAEQSGGKETMCLNTRGEPQSFDHLQSETPSNPPPVTGANSNAGIFSARMGRDVAAGVAVSIGNVRKVYGNPQSGNVALHGISIDIGDNEFFTLLGPSGCGKTTLLRLIAGFEQPTAGTTRLFGQEISRLPPYKRKINTVFQDYALFPHMTVAENIRFGMENRRFERTRMDERTSEMLQLVKMERFADRKPTQLSGGQQQRVALARALAPEPEVLLLDEPLSALDLKLRQAMRMELKAIQEQTGITFVFVTHDQEEALSMSDRIAVMSEGRVQQTGSPDEIYESPNNRFVANFIGETNFIEGTVESVEDNRTLFRCENGYLIACAPSNASFQDKRCTLSIRPEKIRLVAPETPETLAGTVRNVVYLGTDVHYCVTLINGTEITARLQNDGSSGLKFAMGEAVALQFQADAARLLSEDSYGRHEGGDHE